MNKERRKELQKAVEHLQTASDIIQSCMADEQDYLDNMPENLQGSERYEMAENAVDCLESASDGLDDIISNVESAME